MNKLKGGNRYHRYCSNKINNGSNRRVVITVAVATVAVAGIVVIAVAVVVAVAAGIVSNKGVDV